MLTATTSTAFFTSFFNGPAGLKTYLDPRLRIDLSRLEESDGIFAQFEEASKNHSPRLQEMIGTLRRPLKTKNIGGVSAALKDVADVLAGLPKDCYADIAKRAKMGIVLSAAFFAGDNPLANVLASTSHHLGSTPSARTTFLLGASFLLSGDVDLDDLMKESRSDTPQAQKAARALWQFLNIWPTAPRSGDIEPLIEAGLMQKQAAFALDVVARGNPSVFNAAHLESLIRNAPRQPVFSDIVATLVHLRPELFSSAHISMMLEVEASAGRGTKMGDVLKTLAYNKPELFLREHVPQMARLINSSSEVRGGLECLLERRKDLFGDGGASIVLKCAADADWWQLVGAVVWRVPDSLTSDDISQLIFHWGRVKLIVNMLEFLAQEHSAKFGQAQAVQLWDKRGQRGARKVLKILKEKRPDLFPRRFWWGGLQPAV